VWVRARENLTNVPTLDQRRAEIEQEIGLYNSTLQAALGGVAPMVYYEQHGVERRPADKDVLDFLCTRPAGKRRVGRDGVLYRGIRYGFADEFVWTLQGRTIWLRVDPVDASFIWLCDRDGRPLHQARAETLPHATREDVAEAHKRIVKLKRFAKGMVEGQLARFRTTPDQVRRVLAERRAAEVEAQRAKLPAPPAAVTKVIAPEVAEPLKRIGQRARKQACRRASQPAARQESPFSALAAAMAQDTEPMLVAAPVSFGGYAKELDSVNCTDGESRPSFAGYAEGWADAG
jgi:hypothetical protein